MINKSNVQVGDTVVVVPFGLVGRVNYNENGVISGIDVCGKDSASYVPLSHTTCAKLQKNNVVPSRLVNKRGYVVNGVFEVSGIGVQDVVNRNPSEVLLSAISDGNREVSFKAFMMESPNDSYSFVQQSALMTTLGFNKCSSFVVSSSEQLNRIAKMPSMLLYPKVSGYAIVHKDGYVYEPESFQYLKVSSVQRDVNSSGFIVAEVQFDNGSSITVPYPQVVKYNVQKSSCVVVDSGHIVFCSDRGNLSKKVDREFHCNFCGSLVTSPFDGYVRCPYDNCTSRLYPVVENMTREFNVPCIDYSTYRQYVDEKRITCLVDVFDLPEYKDLKISCTLSTLLKALCPVNVVKNRSFFDKFVEKCGSLEAFHHYIENPYEIESDMSHFVDKTSCQAFSTWISVPENILTVKSVIDIVDVKQREFNLDVPKLFRNKSVYIEGDFNHGSYSVISSILRSYGADIVTTVDTRCDCVLLGDFVRNLEDVPAVNIARSYNIPVYTESYFFGMYDIDSDLSAAK